jgi:flagella basal body P-ring formation protein FlgA
MGEEASFETFMVEKFAEKFAIAPTDVSLKLFHLPEVNLKNASLQMINENESLALGYNRAYLQILKNNQVDREVQITYYAKIQILTPVLTEDIRFGESVNTSIIEMEKREIKNNYEDYFRSDQIAEDLIAKALLRKGEILKKSDLRTKPVINRGQNVNLKVLSGNIIIKMDGIAKEEAGRGEEIRVYNRETRRHYFGIVESPQTVVINIE